MLRCVANGPDADDPAALLGEAAADGGRTVELGPDGVARIVSAALGARGEPPLALPGRAAALERRDGRWRLIAFNAVDPLHGTHVADDLYRPDR